MKYYLQLFYSVFHYTILSNTFTIFFRSSKFDSLVAAWFFKNFIYFLIGRKMLYNFVLVSAIQQLELVIIQFSSVALSCLTLCDLMNCSMPGLPVHHQLPEPTQTHVLWVGDAIQPSHPLLSPSPPALNLSQHQGLFKWVSSSYQVAKLLEFQLQHQSFQWTPKTDLL